MYLIIIIYLNIYIKTKRSNDYYFKTKRVLYTVIKCSIEESLSSSWISHFANTYNTMQV